MTPKICATSRWILPASAALTARFRRAACASVLQHRRTLGAGHPEEGGDHGDDEDAAHDSLSRLLRIRWRKGRTPCPYDAYPSFAPGGAPAASAPDLLRLSDRIADDVMGFVHPEFGDALETRRPTHDFQTLRDFVQSEEAFERGAPRSAAGWQIPGGRARGAVDTGPADRRVSPSAGRLPRLVERRP